MLTKDAVDLLRKHPWRHNLEELRTLAKCIKCRGANRIVDRRVIGRALKRQGRVGKARREFHSWLDRLWYLIASGGKLDEALDLATRLCIVRALAQARGNVAEAARRLQVSRGHLYRCLRKYRIDPSHFRRRRS